MNKMKKIASYLLAGVAAAFLLVSCNKKADAVEAESVQEVSSALVVDVDPGTDDAMVTMLLARNGVQPDYCVSTFGNMPWNYTQRNLNILAKVFDFKAQIACGAKEPYDKHEVTCGDFHGNDALADVGDSLFNALKMTQADIDGNKTITDLADFIMSKDSVTYIVVGPMATLSHLIKDYPETESHIKRVLVMGGGIDTFNKDGDKEYNFAGDGIAVKNVFESSLDITLFPLDITNTKAAISKEQIATIDYSKLPWARNCLEHNLRSNMKYNKIPMAVMHDCLTVLYLLEPSLFKVTDMKLIANEGGHIEKSEEGKTVHVATDLPADAIYNYIKAGIEK